LAASRNTLLRRVSASPRAAGASVNSRPIPRLYSAGELGAIYSYLYQGTGNIGECLAFGRVSGRNAAAETPWK
jgi:predicted oxidoreductase